MKFCFAFLCWCAALAGQQFPQVSAENLQGKATEFPAAASGHPAIVVIGFTHGSQTQCKAWSIRLSHDLPEAQRGWVYSIAVLQDVPKLVRGMVVHSIKGGTPAGERDRFLIVNRGESELKEAAGFDRPDDAYVLVLDANGTRRFKTHGPVSDAAVAAVEAELR